MLREAVVWYARPALDYIPSRTKFVRRRGPDVDFECPHCGMGNIAAVSFEETRTLMLLFVVPAFSVRYTFVVCSPCGVHTRAKMPLEKLATVPPNALSALIADRTPKLGSWLAMVALFLSWVPMFGLGLAAVALAVNRDSRRWPHTWSIIALIFAGVVTGLMSIVWWGPPA